VPPSRDLTYVICWITRGDNLRGVNQLATGVINRLIKELSAETGIDFKPHDTRRTAITALLEAGASVPQARDFARHASGETTLIYAEKTDAMALGISLKHKLKYGHVLGDTKQSEESIQWECDNGHKFFAVEATECPKCGSENLSFQASMFT